MQGKPEPFESTDPHLDDAASALASKLDGSWSAQSSQIHIWTLHITELVKKEDFQALDLPVLIAAVRAVARRPALDLRQWIVWKMVQQLAALAKVQQHRAYMNVFSVQWTDVPAELRPVSTHNLA